MAVHRAIRGQGQVDDSAYVDPSAFIHASALVSIQAYVGPGAYIGPNAYIGLRTIVGAGAHIGSGAFVGADCIICDKARIADAGVVVDGSTILSDCCCDGGGSGGLDVPVLTFDSINVVGDKLASYITTGKKKGTLAYVGNDSFAGQFSVKCYFVLVYGENLTADGLTVVNSPTFGTDGAQWLRQDTTNEQAHQARFWAIDETNGNDENTGWGANQAAADLVPLKTMAELNRRLYGQIIGDGVTVVFHQLTDITVGQVLNNVQVKGTGYALWLGTKKTLLFSGAVTTYTAANPAGNTAAQLNIASIPVSWTASGILRKLIESADASRCAWAVADLTGKTARITTPNTSSSVTKTIAGAASVFTAAETVNIYDVTTIPIWPFRPDALTVGAQYCDWTLGAGNAGRNNLGSSSPYITRCINHTEWKGAPSIDGIRWSGNLIDLNTASLIFGGGRWLITWCGAAGVAVGGGARSIAFSDSAQVGLNHGDLIFQNCALGLNMVTEFTLFGADSHLAFFDFGGSSLISVQNAGAMSKLTRFNPVSFLYGSGNTQPIIDVFAGMSVSLPPKAQCPIVTTAVDKLHVAGISYTFDDMPIMDLFNMCNVSNL